MFQDYRDACGQWRFKRRIIGKIAQPVNPFGCWEWLGWKNSDGYGYFDFGRTKVKAHRLIYEMMVGDIPEDRVLDHLCQNRSCVNPYHIEIVTNKENLLRGDLNGWRKRKTHCPKGHELTPDNLDKYQLSRGERRCKRCKNDRQKERRTGQD